MWGAKGCYSIWASLEAGCPRNSGSIPVKGKTLLLHSVQPGYMPTKLPIQQVLGDPRWSWPLTSTYYPTQPITVWSCSSATHEIIINILCKPKFITSLQSISILFVPSQLCLMLSLWSLHLVLIESIVIAQCSSKPTGSFSFHPWE
jgi:hypothetical protein